MCHFLGWFWKHHSFYARSFKCGIFSIPIFGGQFVGPFIWQPWAALCSSWGSSYFLSFFGVLFKELNGLVPKWPFVLFCLLDLPKSAHTKKKKKKIHSNIYIYIYISVSLFWNSIFKKSSFPYNSALPFLRYLLHLSDVLAITFYS